MKITGNWSHAVWWFSPGTPDGLRVIKTYLRTSYQMTGFCCQQLLMTIMHSPRSNPQQHLLKLLSTTAVPIMHAKIKSTLTQVTVDDRSTNYALSKIKSEATLTQVTVNVRIVVNWFCFCFGWWFWLVVGGWWWWCCCCLLRDNS